MTFLTPEYRGYVGSIEHSKEDGIFFGSIQFITDMVSYESEDLNNIETAFHNAVDEYISDCSSLNKLPDKPTQQKKFVDWHPYPQKKPASYTKNYLLTVEIHYGKSRITKVAIDTWADSKQGGEWEAFDNNPDAVVTAWLELPEPYRSEANNE